MTREDAPVEPVDAVGPADLDDSVSPPTNAGIDPLVAPVDASPLAAVDPTAAAASPTAPPALSPETAPGATALVSLPVVDVQDLDWNAVLAAADPSIVRARMRDIVERMETLLDRVGGPGLLFDADRTDPSDRAIRIATEDGSSPLWIIGDLHGDLLTLEAALAAIRDHARSNDDAAPRIVFLGDFFDDAGYGLELLLRVYELILDAPERVCVVAGNHDEALAYQGGRFTSTVSPSDFSDFLNAHLAHEWIERAGKLAVRLTAHATRALFFPDGLLVCHGGFPLGDLHAKLLETGDWNDPACLSDFVWTRAHPKARRKMPNRFSRGSQFGYEDFADFCALTARLGRPVTHMARGHDHVEERYAVYPAYAAHPVLTTVALSRRLPREQFGSYERVPSIARVAPGALPQVFRLHIPPSIVQGYFPRSEADASADGATSGGAT